MRSSRQLSDASGVASFLMLDQHFPRSILYSLNTADTCLVEVQPPGMRTAFGDTARQSLAQARNTLEFIDPSNLIGQLPELIDMLEQACFRITDAVTDKYFRHEDAVAWNLEEGL